MKILELVLHRYKRIALSGIDTIRYTPETEIQIIIGSNGSGKSSIMDEFSPFPPEKDSILAGGYKFARYLHNGKEYVLRSEYNGKGAGKHTFKVIDGDVEELLNDHGTLTAQKTLIEKHFGVTEEIMDIWLGRTTFTKMPPMKRRDWIIKLNGSDLDYAMNVYKKIKSNGRDAIGVEKHFTRRLAEETNDITDQNMIAELERNISSMTEELNNYLVLKEPNIPSTHLLQLEMKKLKDEFDHHSAEILTLRLVKPNCLANVKNDIHLVDGFISAHEARLQAEERRLSDLYQEKSRITETVQLLQSSGVEKIEELGRVINEEERQFNKQIKQNPLYSKLSEVDVGEVIGAFKGCKNVLTDILANLYDNSDRHYTNDKVKGCKAQHSSLVQKLKGVNDSIVRLRHSLEHIENTQLIECPKCQHGFRPGFTDINPIEIKSQLEQNVNLYTQLENEIKSLNSYLEGATEYGTQIRTLKRLIEDNGILKPLWDLLYEEELFKVPPITHFPTIENFFVQLEECYHLRIMKEQLDTNILLMKNLSNSSTDTSDLTGRHIETLDGNINATIDCIEILKKELNEVTKFSKEVKKAEHSYRIIQNIQQRLTERFDLLVKSHRNFAIGKVIHDKQIQLANTTTALNNLSKREAMLAELEQEKLKAQNNSKVFAALEDVISPTHGIIAKYIQNFIDVFIADINELIEPIWSYPMEILGCGIEAVDVNCKFPLSINEGYLQIDDISRGSDGQQDIINLMFRLIFGEYVGLTDFPLFLDELAPTLDEQHRQNLIRFLSNIMESGKYNQMFMISHYAANHFAFVNAQFLMLDERNIQTKPPVYNEHVEITYRNYEEDAVA